MEEEALEVVERLVNEDDQSVEAWYLGGWCLYLLGQKQTAREDAMDDETDKTAEKVAETVRRSSLLSSREWLRQSLRVYEILDYEDERLRDHAVELVRALDGELEGLDIKGAKEEEGGEVSDDGVDVMEGGVESEESGEENEGEEEEEFNGIEEGGEEEDDEMEESDM